MEKNESVDSMLAGAEGLTGNKKVVEAPAPVVDTTPVPPVVPVPPIVKGPVVNAPLTVATPLGTQVYGGTPLETVNLTSFADVKAFAKDFLGAELNDVKDLVPVFNELKQAKEQAAQAAQLQKAVDGFTSTISNLPPEVALILNAAVQGEDYKLVLQKLQQKATLDYNKPFEAHDPVMLANRYTNRTYTKETFDALDDNSKDALSDSIRLKYETDRNELINFETNTKKATEQRQEKFKSSVESSIANMLVSNPHMGKAEVDRVRQIMQSGLSDILFTKEKNYSLDAAEKIAYMEYGKQTVATQAQTIGDIVKRMTNQEVTKSTEQILLKSDKPQVAGGAPDKNVAAEIVARETAFLRKK